MDDPDLRTALRWVAILLRALAIREGVPEIVTAITHLGTIPPDYLRPPTGDDHPPHHH